MGNPLHYSVELPQRCLQLIEALWPYAQTTLQADRPDLGSLTTTFLISMSMPIINLPVERIEKQKDSNGEGYADDRHIDPRLTEAVNTILGGQKLRKAPFFVSGAWSFGTYSPAFNIAQSFPDNFAAYLGSEEALSRATSMPTSQWCSILRNSMAHGGIAYLDADGQASYGKPVRMYAFVNGRYNEADELTGVNALRISETNYLAFLQAWVKWLISSGLAN